MAPHPLAAAFHPLQTLEVLCDHVRMRSWLPIAGLGFIAVACTDHHSTKSDADFARAMRDPVIRDAYQNDSEFRKFVAGRPGYWAQLRYPHAAQCLHDSLISGNLPPPSEALLNQLEKALVASANRCIGPINRWYRYYSFLPKRDQCGLDPNAVSFTLRRGGAYQSKVGTREADATSKLGTDDSRFEIAFGSYDVASHKIDLEFCGPNLVGS